MTEPLPAHVIQIYQDRLRNIHALIGGITTRGTFFSTDDQTLFVGEIHKLIGVAGYFHDLHLALNGRELEQFFKTQPGHTLTPESLHRLTTFQSLLRQSPHFKP